MLRLVLILTAAYFLAEVIGGWISNSLALLADAGYPDGEGFPVLSMWFNRGNEDILEALGGLPEESRHCALLASSTLRAAIDDYRLSHREPWRKLYRTDPSR